MTWNGDKAECPAGHSYAEHGRYIHPPTGRRRVCRLCRSAATKRWRKAVAERDAQMARERLWRAEVGL